MRGVPAIANPSLLGRRVPENLNKKYGCVGYCQRGEVQDPTGSVWLRGRESLCHVDGAQWGRGIQLPTSRETRYLLVS